MQLKLKPRGEVVFIKAGPKGGPLLYIEKTDLREFADRIHDLADEIDREQREREWQG